MMIGPGGLNVVTELVEMETLASVGIALVLFSLGSEFSISDLISVKRLAVYGGLLSMGMIVILSVVAGPLLGLTDNARESIVVGLAVSLSSTAVVLQCISNPSTESNLRTPRGSGGSHHNNGQSVHASHSNSSNPAGSLAAAIPHSPTLNSESAGDDPGGFDSPRCRKALLALLVFQDVAIGLIVALLPALKGTLSTFAEEILGSFLRLCAFIVLSLLIAEFVLPSVLDRIDRTGSETLFTLSCLLFCLVIAYASEQLGLAIELGAFSAGIMIAESKYRERVESAMSSVKDVFASVFFVAIGMVIHWKYFYQNLFRVILMLLFILTSKSLAMGSVVYFFGGLSPRIAASAGIALSQAGEFTFVIASKAQALQMFSGSDLRVLNGATALSMLITPLLVRIARDISRKKTQNTTSYT